MEKWLLIEKQEIKENKENSKQTLQFLLIWGFARKILLQQTIRIEKFSETYSYNWMFGYLYID